MSAAEARFCWLAGDVMPLDEARVPVRDRGFLFGEGVFETIRIVRGRPWRLEKHVARMRDAARDLEIAEPAGGIEALARSAADALCERIGGRDGVLKLILTAGDPPDLAPSFLAMIGPPRAIPVDARERGVNVVTVRDCNERGSATTGRKSLAYFDNIVARRKAAKEGAFEAIRVAQCHGRSMIEGTATNLFFVKDGQLETPPASSGCVPGIARAAVLEVALLAGIQTLEKDLGTVLGRQEAFLTNALIGIVPINAIDEFGLPVPFPGPITQRLTTLLDDLIARETETPAS